MGRKKKLPTELDLPELNIDEALLRSEEPVIEPMVYYTFNFDEFLNYEGKMPYELKLKLWRQAVKLESNSQIFTLFKRKLLQEEFIVFCNGLPNRYIIEDLKLK